MYEHCKIRESYRANIIIRSSIYSDTINVTLTVRNVNLLSHTVDQLYTCATHATRDPCDLRPIDIKNLPLAPCGWQGFEEGGGDRPILPFRDQYGKRTVPGVAKPGPDPAGLRPGGLGIKDNRPHGRPVTVYYVL